MGHHLLSEGGLLGNPVKRWEQAERCLQAHNIQYDMVQSENPRSVDRLVRMLISNGYKTIIIYGGDSALMMRSTISCS